MTDLTFQQMEHIVDHERMLRVREQWIVEYLLKPHHTARKRADIAREISAPNDELEEALDRMEERGAVTKDLSDRYHLPAKVMEEFQA